MDWINSYDWTKHFILVVVTFGVYEGLALLRNIHRELTGIRYRLDKNATIEEPVSRIPLTHILP